METLIERGCSRTEARLTDAAFLAEVATIANVAAENASLVIKGALPSGQCSPLQGEHNATILE